VARDVDAGARPAETEQRLEVEACAAAEVEAGTGSRPDEVLDDLSHLGARREVQVVPVGDAVVARVGHRIDRSRALFSRPDQRRNRHTIGTFARGSCAYHAPSPNGWVGDRDGCAGARTARQSAPDAAPGVTFRP